MAFPSYAGLLCKVTEAQGKKGFSGWKGGPCKLLEMIHKDYVTQTI